MQATPKSNNKEWLMPPRLWIFSLVFLGIFGLIHYRILFQLLEVAAVDPRWHYIFGIPIVSLLIIYTRRNALRKCPTWIAWPGLLIALGGLALYGFGYAISSGMIMGVATVIELFGFAWFFFGWPVMRYLGIPIFYLLFAVEFNIIYNFSTNVYTAILAHISTLPVNIAGLIMSVEADAYGTEIQLFDNGLAVKPPLDVGNCICDLRTLMVLTAAAIAIAFFRRRHYISIIIILVSGIVLSIVSDLVNTVIACFLFTFTAPLIQNGCSHFTGYVFTAFSILALLGIAKLTNRISPSTPYTYKSN